MEHWSNGVMSFLKVQYSTIPIFQIMVFVVALFFSSCAGTERFGKRDSGSNSEYKNERSSGNLILETIDGVASYYSDEFQGRKTANGETYNMYELTAAHKTYPFNTIVRVTNLTNGKSIILRINDRMPNYNKRIIDISFQAARELDMIISGISNVKIEVLEWGE